MRLILLTILLMGGSAIMLQFVFLDTVRLKKSRDAQAGSDAGNAVPRYHTEILPLIQGDRGVPGGPLAPTGRVAFLTAMYKERPNEALRGLGSLSHETAVDALWNIFAAEKAPERRALVLIQLARTGHARARKYLKEVSEDARLAESERSASKRLLDAF